MENKTTTKCKKCKGTGGYENADKDYNSGSRDDSICFYCKGTGIQGGCNCEEMTCKEDCTKSHTHKGFSCENCKPKQEENESDILIAEHFLKNQEQTMEERKEDLYEAIENFDKSLNTDYQISDFLNEYTDLVTQQVVQQERERGTRKTIKDIAEHGVTGGMFAITKTSVNGKNTFPVVSVHFGHDLVALNDFDDEDNPTWYRAEDIINLINKDHE